MTPQDWLRAAIILAAGLALLVGSGSTVYRVKVDRTWTKIRIKQFWIKLPFVALGLIAARYYGWI